MKKEQCPRSKQEEQNEQKTEMDETRIDSCCDSTMQQRFCTFTTEAEDVTESVFIPADVKTLAINPLNWKTDGEKAGKEMNLGACFTDYEGTILKEIPELTGAYLDGKRGTLKVTDIDPAEYSNTLSILAPGVYHLYDYQFFYRNLQKNVQTRIDAYLSTHLAQKRL